MPGPRGRAAANWPARRRSGRAAAGCTGRSARPRRRAGASRRSPAATKQPGQEPEPLSGELPGGDRGQSGSTHPRPLRVPADLGDGEPVAGPEPHDRIGERVLGGLHLREQAERHGKPLVDRGRRRRWPSAGARRTRGFPGRGRRPPRPPPRPHRSGETADSTAARSTFAGSCRGVSLLTTIRLTTKPRSRARWARCSSTWLLPAPKPPPSSRPRAVVAHASDPVEQRVEPVLDLGLAGAERGHGVAARDARAQRLDGAAGRQPRIPRLLGGRRHETASSRVSSRTSAANGLARRRSRISSITRRCRAL